VADTESSYFTKTITADLGFIPPMHTTQTTEAMKKPTGRKPRPDKSERVRQVKERTLENTTPSITEYNDPKDTGTSLEPPIISSKARSTKAKSTNTKSKTSKAGLEGSLIPKVPKAKKVPKVAGTSKPRARVPKETTGAVSKHFQPDSVSGRSCADKRDPIPRNTSDDSIWDVPISPCLKNNALQEPQHPVGSNPCLDLEEAVARRRDWTPIKDSHREVVFTDVAGKENNIVGMEQKKQFTSILSNFTFADAQLQPALPTNGTSAEGPAKMKKRKVDLINVPGKGQLAPNASPEKRKAPKKKARTITDIVTGHYAPEEHADDALSDKRDFFELRTASPPVESNKRVPKISRTKSVTKQKPGKTEARSKKASAKTAANPKLVANALLSPSSAIMKMNKQDVLFGTSSQLALEESPTMIRQIQHAIRESELDSESLTPLTGEVSEMRWRVSTMPGLQKIEGRGQLWAASARDDDGYLLEKQHDMYIPEPDRTQDFPLLMDGTGEDSSFANIDDFELPPQRLKSGHESAAITTATVSTKATSIADATAVADDFAEPPRSNQNASSEFPDIDDLLAEAHCGSLRVLQRTNSSAEAFTAASPLRRRRGRPPKSHSAISKGNSSCTTADNRRSSTSASPTKRSSWQTPVTPQKSKTRFANVEEILDSEDDEALSPTPPRSVRRKDALPLPLARPQPTAHISESMAGENADADLIPVFQIPASQLSWGNVKDSIFDLITSHVRSIPPSTDPSKPSWHEKMLMYDPIVVEDFTAYLCSNTSIRTYRRATKVQIKAWNKKVKATSGDVFNIDDTGEQVLAVKKGLESWMVQYWCQEHSICCISKGARARVGFGKALY
jgi:hypothetical protein